MPSELREALNALGASALIAKVIDPILLEYQRRMSPLCRSIPMQQWNSDVYYFNQRNQVASGGFVPDGGARTVSNSVYVQNGFKMAHVQSVGAVTGYAQEVTRQVIGDLRQTEIQGSIQGYFWDIEAGIMWGNSASTINQGAQPQFDGFDTQVAQFTQTNNAPQNAIDKAGATFTLSTLDELADVVHTNAAMAPFNTSWQYTLSNTAMSKAAQLLQNQQRFVGEVEIAAGLLVPTYRRIPLIETSFLSARSVSMATVTPSTGTSGEPAGIVATLPASTTYRYVVTAVMARSSESLPCAEVTQATGGSGSNFIILSFTPPTGFEGAGVQLYKVYRTAANGAAGSETFLGYVDSSVGLMPDNVTPYPTNQIVDIGTALVPQTAGSPATIPAILPQQYYGTNTGMLPPAAGQENIYLHSRDKQFLCRPYVREAVPLDVYPTTASPDSLPYAIMGDTTFAIKAPKYAARAARVSVSL